ncbi:MAG: phenol 2-monooxygenase [Bdellovibrio sp. CG10_big_fil_rev_8_21_14_0_10_47_8]|nr:MAG: phenol 2-monooxygenase [Bdellovibrio sp. CG10_big_fil_rev_8_21_14_0_10_47_8]
MSSTRIPHKMKVAEIIDHTHHVRELVIVPTEPSEFTFKAGQFITLHVPQEPKPVLRAYSIASDDREKQGFRLLFKYVPEGIASTYVWSLKGSEILSVTGPFGRVFFKEPPSEQIIFLNTGTGLSQHYCYLMSKKELFPKVRYRMLFGVRTEQDVYYQPQLEALKKELPDFQYEYVISRPTENWTGKRGYVQHFLSEFDYKNIDTTFYLCGNGGMIKEVKAHLIEKDGFDKSKIFAEAFD